MKAGLSIATLAQRLVADAAANRDFIADTRRLTVAPAAHGITLELPSGSDTVHLAPTALASRQLAEFTEIPAKYWDRMAKTAPELLAKNVGHWFANEPAPRLLRTRINGTSTLRAFLSNRYRTIDNHDLANIVLPLLGEPGWRIESAQITDTRLYIQAVTDRVQAEVKKGDVVQAGVVISNSEVGNGALTISPLCFRLACTNGLIVGSALRRNHVGRSNGGDDDAFEYFSDDTRRADDAALALKIRDVVRAAVNDARFEQIVAKLAASTKIDLPGDPAEIVEITAARFGLDDTERGQVLRHLALGGDLSLFGLVQAVTRAGQDAELYDRAVELERLGSDVLAMPVEVFSKN